MPAPLNFPMPLTCARRRTARETLFNWLGQTLIGEICLGSSPAAGMG
jgi:hypothetical protein